MTETEIIAGCRKKSAAHQRMLFDLFSPRLMTVCRRYAASLEEAEDMLQESFIRIFSAIHQYRGEGSLEGWLRKVTVNTCLRKLEGFKMRWASLSALDNTPEEELPDIISAISAKELVELVSKLPAGYRVVFNLSVIEGYDHAEIAQMLGIEPSTSRSQLVKARKMLQKQLLLSQKKIKQGA